MILLSRHQTKTITGKYSRPKERDNIERRAVDYTKRKSINFIGVRKEGYRKKQHVYDPENFTFRSQLKVQRHDFEIEDYVDQQVNSSVDYAYTFKPKPIEPLRRQNL
jgi:cell surface protein SprA